MTVEAMDVWNRCLVELRGRIRNEEIDTWLRTCELTIADDAAVIHVGNRFKAEWILKTYLLKIMPVLDQLTGKKLDIKFSFKPRHKKEESLPKERAALPTRAMNCERHGVYASQIIRVGNTEIAMKCPHCAAEEKEGEDRREQAILFEHRIKKQQEQAAEMISLLGMPALPDIQSGKGFTQFETDGSREKENIKKKCSAFAASFPARWEEGEKKRSMGLCLQGTTGAGKGHIACAIGAHVSKKGFTVQYITASEIILKARDFDKQEKVIGMLSSVDLLIIDDIGIGNQTDHGLNILFLVIDARIRKQIPTMYTTNLTPEELKKNVGDPIYSRIDGSTFPIVMPFDDYRPIERKKMEKSFFG